MDEQSELHDGGISKEEKEAILTKSTKHKHFKEEKKAEDMPEGWILHIHKRPKGHIDRYWFTPKTCKRLRSRPEVKRFLECLKKCNDDEDRAWDLFKGQKSPKSTPVTSKRKSSRSTSKAKEKTETKNTSSTTRKKAKLNPTNGKAAQNSPSKIVSLKKVASSNKALLYDSITEVSTTMI
mmetsp:Transcript_18652/g.21552  ORF Transcript_18652/g.21552 Transcript_18652/m.21552 type:complete len:180 (-) Transcript_18652:253-792(-)